MKRTVVTLSTSLTMALFFAIVATPAAAIASCTAICDVGSVTCYGEPCLVEDYYGCEGEDEIGSPVIRLCHGGDHQGPSSFKPTTDTELGAAPFLGAEAAPQLSPRHPLFPVPQLSPRCTLPKLIDAIGWDIAGQLAP